MTASWFSVLVFSGVLLRVAENMPLENGISMPDGTSLDKYGDSLPTSILDESNEKESDSSHNLIRDKRTIGFLRQLFPGLSQIVDRKIQQITRFIFRIVGRLVLRGAGGGGGGNGNSGAGKVSITLPTFPPSTDEEEEEEGSTNATTTDGSEDAQTTTEASDAENSVAESNISETKVRLRRETEDDDQAADATGGKDNDLDSVSTDDDENNDENTRNKRLLNFGGGSGGSGGGSGNIIFDLIRLVAGSGSTQERDEAANAPTDGTDESTGKDDGYSAGVPGPLTRLFVIANRGIANLVQDLILRLAQTSERIVNFKARLITSII